MRTFFNPEWKHPNNVLSIQSLRTGGFSTAPFESLNLGVFSSDPAIHKNLQHLTTHAHLPHEPRFLRQTHSAKVVELDESHRSAKQGFVQADACITRIPGVICGVLSADCLPILLCDAPGTVVAAVHAGWRGLYSGIIAKTIQAMAVPPCNLSAWIGPGISYSHYAVDVAFRQRFIEKDPHLAKHFYYSNDSGQWHADLKGIARHQLQRCQVKSIAQTPLCTFQNPSLFYSHRRDTRRQGDTGRQASLIWLQR